MPNENNDLKGGTKETDANGQAETNLETELSLDAPTGEEGESVEVLKERLVKAERDRDNYKTAALKYKKGQSEDENESDDESDEAEEEEKVSQPNIAEIAREETLKIIEKQNEKTAISNWLKANPAYSDLTNWKELLSNFSSKSGKSTVEGIYKDLDAAAVLTNHYNGGKVGGKEIKLTEMSTHSMAGSSASREESGSLKESTIEMGSRFRNSADALSKEDDSQYAEIKI